MNSENKTYTIFGNRIIEIPSIFVKHYEELLGPLTVNIIENLICTSGCDASGTNEELKKAFHEGALEEMSFIQDAPMIIQKAKESGILC